MRKTLPVLMLLLLVGGGAAAGPGGCRLEVVSETKVSEEGGLGQIEIHGRIGAVLQRNEGIVAVLDLKDPRRPKVLGRYDDDARRSLDGDLAFSDDGQWLFYARQTVQFSLDGLHVLNVANPAQPTLMDYQPQGGSLRVAYFKQGDAEWVISLDAVSGLVVNRFVRPSGTLVPVHTDALPATKVGGPASAGLFVDPKDPALGVPLLYVTTGTTGLQVFDFSDPVSPELLGSWGDEGLADIEVVATKKSRTVRAATEYWFEKSTEPAVLTLDATNLDAIELESRWSGGYPAEDALRVQGLALKGDGLFVSHSEAGLLAIRGGRVCSRLESDYAMDVEVAGSFVYFSDAVDGKLTTVRFDL